MKTKAIVISLFVIDLLLLGLLFYFKETNTLGPINENKTTTTKELSENPQTKNGITVLATPSQGPVGSIIKINITTDKDIYSARAQLSGYFFTLGTEVKGDDMKGDILTFDYIIPENVDKIGARAGEKRDFPVSEGYYDINISITEDNDDFSTTFFKVPFKVIK